MTDKPKRKQFRRAISVTRVRYDQIRAHCETNNRSMSGFVDELINKSLDKAEAIERWQEAFER